MSLKLVQHDQARDRAAVIRMIVHAFAGTAGGVEEWLGLAGPENLRTLLDGDRPAANILRIPMGQYFGGRSVRHLGIAAVAVAPEDRGRGYAKAMMQEAVRQAAAEGWAVMGLYASTHTLYRSVGFEHAGHRFQYTVPFVRIDASERAGEVVSLGENDMDELKACYARFASRFDGMMDRGPYLWHRARKFRDENYSGFGVQGAAGLEGYVFLNQKRLPAGRAEVSLTDFVFTTPSAGRRLWGFLADFSMMSEDLVFSGGPTHPALTLLNQQRHKVECKDSWLIRIADLKAALEERGYSPAVRAEVHLDVHDDLVSANTGKWVLRVEGGRARAERGGRGDLTLGVRGLATVYSGYYTPVQAALLGLVEGSEQALAATGSVFSAGTPWMSDMY